MSNKIRIPADKINTFIRSAYSLSQPQGMGILHYNPAPMTVEEADEIINAPHNHRYIGMDYVLGRAVKLTIFKDDEGYYIEDRGRWFDHTDSQWRELQESISMEGMP